MWKVAYAPVESALVKMNSIAPEKRIAFKARLKNFQREGWPEGINTGTGRKAGYSFSAIVQLTLAIELSQIGLPPKRVVKMLRQMWGLILVSVIGIILPDDILQDDDELRAFSGSFAWVFYPEALYDLAPEDDRIVEQLMTAPVRGLGKIFSPREHFAAVGSEEPVAPWRTAALHANAIVNGVMARLIEQGVEIQIDEIRADLITEALACDAQTKLRAERIYAAIDRANVS